MNVSKVQITKPLATATSRARLVRSSTGVAKPKAKPGRALRFLPRSRAEAREPVVPGQYLG